MGNNQSGDGAEGKKPEFTIIPKMFSLSIWVPTEQVGMIIGKKGATIQKIQKDTHSTVTVPQENGPEKAWSLVVIKGEPENTFEAYKTIADMVEDTDECIADFPIPKSKHSLIVGKNGTTIRRLSADNNTRINVPDKRLEPNNSMIQLEGEVENVASCFRDIVEELHSKLSKKKDVTAGADHPKTKDRRVTGPPVQQRLDVPQKKMGLVIGKKGMVIKEISRRLGVKLTIVPPKPSGEPAQDEATAAAAAAIKSIVDTVVGSESGEDTTTVEGGSETSAAGAEGEGGAAAAAAAGSGDGEGAAGEADKADAGGTRGAAEAENGEAADAEEAGADGQDAADVGAEGAEGDDNVEEGKADGAAEAGDDDGEKTADAEDGNDDDDDDDDGGDGEEDSDFDDDEEFHDAADEGEEGGLEQTEDDIGEMAAMAMGEALLADDDEDDGAAGSGLADGGSAGAATTAGAGGDAAAAAAGGKNARGKKPGAGKTGSTPYEELDAAFASNELTIEGPPDKVEATIKAIQRLLNNERLADVLPPRRTKRGRGGVKNRNKKKFSKAGGQPQGKEGQGKAQPQQPQQAPPPAR